MDEVVELVVVIPTSQRSSKTESGCKSYHHFCVYVSSWPNCSALGQKIRRHAEPRSGAAIWRQAEPFGSR
jgi:hypothetical protein